jgi:hypothetical protein
MYINENYNHVFIRQGIHFEGAKAVCTPDTPGTVVRHSREKGAIIILAIFFFNLYSHFNLYNDVVEKKNHFEGRMGKLVF